MKHRLVFGLSFSYNERVRESSPYQVDTLNSAWNARKECTADGEAANV
jgi:hypothetical protein